MSITDWFWPWLWSVTWNVNLILQWVKVRFASTCGCCGMILKDEKGNLGLLQMIHLVILFWFSDLDGFNRFRTDVLAWTVFRVPFSVASTFALLDFDRSTCVSSGERSFKWNSILESAGFLFHHLKIAAFLNRTWFRRIFNCISRLSMKWERKVIGKWGDKNFDISFNIRSLFRRWCSSVRTPASRGMTEFGWSYTGWMLELQRTKVAIPLSFDWVCFEVTLHNMNN